MNMRTRGKRILAATTEILLASVVAVGLFASGSVFPVLGIGLSLLCPIPFVVVGSRHGRMALAGALAVATLILAVPLSGLQGIVFLLEFGAPAVVLEVCLRRGVRSEVVVVAVAAILAIGGLGVLAAVSGHWSDPAKALELHLDTLLTEMETLTARMGLSEGAGTVEAPTRRLRGALLTAFPGLLFVGSLLTASGYVCVLQAMVRRWPTYAGAARPVPSRWELPEVLVWAFIGSGVCYLTGLPGLATAGINGLIILLGLYFLQGLSIAAFLFRR